MKSDNWLLVREFLKKYLSEKQNGYLQVVAYERWSLREVVAMRDRVDCGMIFLQDTFFLPVPYSGE